MAIKAGLTVRNKLENPKKETNQAFGRPKARKKKTFFLSFLMKLQHFLIFSFFSCFSQGDKFDTFFAEKEKSF